MATTHGKTSPQSSTEAAGKGAVTLLGIDPGASTGLATYYGGKLLSLETITPLKLERTIRERAPARVIFEDSRLQSRAWTARAKINKGAGLATARDLGQVDAWCRLIVEICAELGIPAHGISQKHHRAGDG